MNYSDLYSAYTGTLKNRIEMALIAWSRDLYINLSSTAADAAKYVIAQKLTTTPTFREQIGWLVLKQLDISYSVSPAPSDSDIDGAIGIVLGKFILVTPLA